MHSALWKHSFTHCIQESILQLGWPAPNIPSPVDFSQVYLHVCTGVVSASVIPLNYPSLKWIKCQRKKSKTNKQKKPNTKSRKVFSNKVCLSQFWHNNLCCVKFISCVHRTKTRSISWASQLTEKCNLKIAYTSYVFSSQEQEQETSFLLYTDSFKRKQLIAEILGKNCRGTDWHLASPLNHYGRVHQHTEVTIS